MSDPGSVELPFIVVAAAIIHQEGKVFITRRKLDADQGGLWEFPGGKQEKGESLEQCLKRELKEEIDVEVSNIEPFWILRHRYPEKEVELHFFTCSLVAGNPQPIGCIEMAWVPPKELGTYPFPAADKPVLEKIRQGIRENRV